MGQAKERKARLGEWYGKEIGPGHPDFVPPKRPEPIRSLLRFDMIDGCTFDGCGKLHEAKIDHFNMYNDRIEVEFVEGDSQAFWPVFVDGKLRGKLTIGSRKFGDVELVRYTETGCVFLRSQSAREEPSDPEPTGDSSEEHRTREEPIEEPRRSVRMFPNRRLPGFAMIGILGMVMASGIDLGPKPEHRPKKR